jgi:hypothetical protein
MNCDDAASGPPRPGARADGWAFARLVQGTVCKILDAHEVKPHKVRYYFLEGRVPPSGVGAVDK